ncbi:MAG: prmA [Ilumatobacteraceae bacterium]|nr:prmA [Ilumatobacteraceae bacterium]
MQAVVISVDPLDVEVASDELWSLGVVAVEERLTGTGAVELWTSLGDDESSIVAALAGLRWPWRFEYVDESVSETWRQHAVPVWIADDLVVHPAWIDPGDIGEAIAIAIEPGATFGLGDHPTTILTMLAMRAVSTPGATVLDVGCGSGVLSVAACLFGAGRVVAVDISPASVPTTRHNAELNGIGRSIEVSTTPLAAVDGSYDIVLANILAPTLIDLAADLICVTADDGRLIISGILTEHHDHVLAALAPLHPVAHLERDGWSAITLSR